jgi:hypothetical protein
MASALWIYVIMGGRRTSLVQKRPLLARASLYIEDLSVPSSPPSYHKDIVDT